ncbi:MAG: alkaline phosphatase [bacterium]
MKITKFFTLAFLLISALVLFVFANYKSNVFTNSGKSVILVIADGMGLGIISAYDYYKSEYLKEGYSNFKDFDGAFLVRTRSQDYVVTDSAAAATAFATGKRVPNYQVGVMENNKRLPTIMDIAKSKGKSTGIIVECSLTHATPAAFYSYSKSRKDDQNIASQFVYSNIDLAMGGGAKYFKPYYEILKKQNYTILENEDQLYQVIKEKRYINKLLAFTAEKHPPKYSERKTKLNDKTQYALSILSQNTNGFFLMIEASQIDWFAHENKLKEEIEETEDLDKLIPVLLNYQKSNPNTLVILLSDHECGGLTLIDSQKSSFSLDFKVNYSSNYHTAEHTVGFYKGFIKPKAIIDNTEVFEILYDYLKN